MVVYGGNYLHCCWPCFAHPPAIELGHGKSPIYAVAHFPLCSWDLLCCSSHTENQHNPKIWGWSMKRNHLGISSWFHRRYDTVPTPCWSILLLISSSPIARNSQKKQHLLMSGWAGWSGWPPQLKWFNHVTLSSNMAMEHPENPPCFSGGSQPGLWVTGRSGLSPLPRSPTPGSGPPRYHHI